MKKNSINDDTKFTLTFGELRRLVKEKYSPDYSVYTMIASYTLDGRLFRHRFKIIAPNDKAAEDDIRFKMRKTLSPYHNSFGITYKNVKVEILSKITL